MCIRDRVGTQLRVLKIFSYMSPIMNIVLNLSVVAVIYIGSIKVQSGGVTPGSVMAAITYPVSYTHLPCSQAHFPVFSGQAVKRPFFSRTLTRRAVPSSVSGFWFIASKILSAPARAASRKLLCWVNWLIGMAA